MSAAAPVRDLPGRAAARSAAAPRPRPVTSRPSLRVVAPRTLPAGPLPFALLVSGVLGAGLVVLLMLHTLAAQDAFTVHKLQRQAATLGDVEQQLAVANEQAQAPTAFAARARALGMVPTGGMQVIRHRDGRIVAVASALPAPAPKPSPATSPQPAAKPSAGAAGPSASPTAQPTTTAATTKPVRHRTKPRHPH